MDERKYKLCKIHRRAGNPDEVRAAKRLIIYRIYYKRIIEE